MRTIGRTVAIAMALQDRKRGERIAQLREERAHMNQQELAQAMGIALRTVQKWEAGHGMQAANKRALAEALHASIEEIMGETEPVDPFSLARHLDANTELFREWCEEMRTAFARVEANVDRLTVALLDGGASSPAALQGFREALERQAAAHADDAPPAKRTGTSGQR